MTTIKIPGTLNATVTQKITEWAEQNNAVSSPTDRYKIRYVIKGNFWLTLNIVFEFVEISETNEIEIRGYIERFVFPLSIDGFVIRRGGVFFTIDKAMAAWNNLMQALGVDFLLEKKGLNIVKTWK